MRTTREKLVELAAPEPGEHVLDVGCGTGSLVLALKARIGAGEAHGIDASTEMINVAKEKATKSGSRLRLQVALIEALPFPDASFELVTSSLMLHHLTQDQKRAGLAQVRRVLKPGGRFVAMDFARRSHSPLGHLISAFAHTHGESSADELVPMLKEAGFGEVETLPTRYKNFTFLRAR